MRDYWLTKDLLQAAGIGFLLLAAISIGLALWLPKKWWGKLLAVLAVGFVIAIPIYKASQESQQQQVAVSDYKERLATAQALFEERCKTAGEKIFKTVENVDGVLLMKVFKNTLTNDLVMSFRSTEFIDDAARDNQATNTLEVKEFGWAFGQIADMEAWYAELKADSTKLGNNSFSVTGYSLGGHLATAFNLMRSEDARTAGVPNPITSTYTFNGAGVGEINNAQTLSNLIADFNRKRQNLSGNEITFSDPDAQALYAELRPAFGAAGTSFGAEFIKSEAARIERMRNSLNPPDLLGAC
jgi:hypothetical protein